MNDNVLQLIQSFGDRAFYAFIIYIVLKNGVLYLIWGSVVYGIRCAWPWIKEHNE